MPEVGIGSVTHRTPYIILTTNKLMESAKIIASYRNKNYNVKIITIENIGTSNPNDIRNYLKKTVSEKGYLLILGNEDTIPRPSMYPSETVHFTSSNLPSETRTDLYYALLNEDIDKDNDSFPGEFYDDKINIVPNLFVGRIPFNSNEEIEKIFYHTVQFEKNSPQSALLAASFISYPGEIYQGAKIFSGDGAREEELIGGLIGENVFKLYEKSGSFPSIHDTYLPLTKNNFYSLLPSAGFVDWVAHGSSSGAYREIWNDKNQNGIPEEGEYEFKSFVSKDDSFKASGIFFSGSCLNESGTNNLGKAILQKGAVAFIGSTGISFSPSYFTNPHDGGTGSINYYFVKNLVSGKTVGASLYSAFQKFFENDLYNNIEDPLEGNLMDIYDYNLYGDPAVVWRRVKKKKIEYKTSTKSKNPITVNVDGKKDITFTLNIPEKTCLFMLLPHGIYIETSTEKSAIIDNTFGIIRLNNIKGKVAFKGIARGNINGTITIKDSITNGKLLENKTLNISIKGYCIRDIDTNGQVDNNDLKAIIENFGKTYMDREFNFFSDLNFDHRVNGNDLFIFLFP